MNRWRKKRMQLQVRGGACGGGIFLSVPLCVPSVSLVSCTIFQSGWCAMFVSHVCAGCFCGDAGLPSFPSLSRSLDLRDLPLAARQRIRKQVSLSSGSVVHLCGVSKVNGRNQMVECKRADEGGSMPHWNDVRVVDVARGLPPTTCRTAFISSRCL